MLKFEYTNRGPLGCIPPTPVRTNLITLEWDNGRVKYTRQFVSKDGSLSSGISDTFGSEASLSQIVKTIHWGCCGWQAALFQVPTLENKVKDFLATKD